MSAPDEHIAHVLGPEGVTPTRFVRDGARWTNAETISVPAGGTLDFGNGWVLSNSAQPFGDELGEALDGLQSLFRDEEDL